MQSYIKLGPLDLEFPLRSVLLDRTAMEAAMKLSCGGLALLAVLATVQPARAQCFWNGAAWVCWTHPLFPQVSLMPDANPYWHWAQNWGGSNWRFYGWQSR